MLNQTSRKQAEPVWERFFKIWPDAEHASQAVPELVANVLKPIGLHRRRASTLVKMSQAFLDGFDDPLELPGIGKYGADSYNIFVRGVLIEDVLDKELKRFVGWAQERARLFPEPEGAGPGLWTDPLSALEEGQGV